MACATLAEARAAKRRAKECLAQVPGVVGLGLTRLGDGYAVKVNLQTAVELQKLPTEVDGVPLVFEVVGTIQRH